MEKLTDYDLEIYPLLIRTYMEDWKVSEAVAKRAFWAVYYGRRGKVAKAGRLIKSIKRRGLKQDVCDDLAFYTVPKGQRS